MSKESSFLLSLFNQLNDQNVLYLVLRGYRGLPHKICNDVDFFVKESSVSSFVRTLTAVAALFDAEIKVDTIRQGVAKCLVEGKHLQVKIDFWFEITFWGLKYTDHDKMIENRRFYKSGGFFIPCEASEFEVSFLKEIFHNQRIRADKIVELRNLLPPESLLESSVLTGRYYSATRKQIAKEPGKTRRLAFLLLLSLVCWNFKNYSFPAIVKSVLEFVSIKFIKPINESEKQRLFNI